MLSKRREERETLREHTWWKDFGDVPVSSRPDQTGDALIPHVTEFVDEVRDTPLWSRVDVPVPQDMETIGGVQENEELCGWNKESRLATLSRCGTTTHINELHINELHTVQDFLRDVRHGGIIHKLHPLHDHLRDLGHDGISLNTSPSILHNPGRKVHPSLLLGKGTTTRSDSRSCSKICGTATICSMTESVT